MFWKTKIYLHEMPGFEEGMIVQREQDGCTQFFLRFSYDEDAIGPYDLQSALNVYMNRIIEKAAQS